MPDIVKISELNEAVALTGSELVPIVQDDQTVRTTAALLAALATPSPVNALSASAKQLSFRADAATDSGAFLEVPGELNMQFTGGATWPAKNYATYVGGLDKALNTTAASTNASRGVINAQGIVDQPRFTAGGGGGFAVAWHFSPVAVDATQRALIGALTSNADPFSGDTDPSSKGNVLAFAKDAADVNLQFMHNDGAGSCTKVNTGLAWADLANIALIAGIACSRDGASVQYSLTDAQTGDELFSGTASTNLPALDVPLNGRCEINTAAGSSALSIAVTKFLWDKYV